MTTQIEHDHVWFAKYKDDPEYQAELQALAEAELKIAIKIWHAETDGSGSPAVQRGTLPGSGEGKGRCLTA